jgi:hypothetical protein
VLWALFGVLFFVLFQRTEHARIALYAEPVIKAR